MYFEVVMKRTELFRTSFKIMYKWRLYYNCLLHLQQLCSNNLSIKSSFLPAFLLLMIYHYFTNIKLPQLKISVITSFEVFCRKLFFCHIIVYACFSSSGGRVKIPSDVMEILWDLFYEEVATGRKISLISDFSRDLAVNSQVSEETVSYHSSMRLLLIIFP